MIETINRTRDYESAKRTLETTLNMYGFDSHSKLGERWFAALHLRYGAQDKETE